MALSASLDGTTERGNAAAAPAAPSRSSDHRQIWLVPAVGAGEGLDSGDGDGTAAAAAAAAAAPLLARGLGEADEAAEAAEAEEEELSVERVSEETR